MEESGVISTTMTDEEVHSLSSDQLIEMVANNEDIPYDQMTDEQLDLMEEIMNAFMVPEGELESPGFVEEEKKSTSKQRILRDVKKIDGSKFSKFSETTETSSTQKKVKGKYDSRSVKKMDTTKKNLFVKRHDMRARMIEPTTVVHVRKLKSQKLDFLSQTEEAEKAVDKDVEIGRLKLKEFFGIEEEGSQPKTEAVHVNKLNVQEIFNSLASPSDETESQSTEKIVVGKLNIKEAFNPESDWSETPKEVKKVGKLNRSQTFSAQNSDEPKIKRTESLNVKKIDISKAFPVDQLSEGADKPATKANVGRLNVDALFQSEESDEKVASEKPKPGKLNTANLFADQENTNEENCAKPVAIGKLNVEGLFTENCETAEKPKIDVGKLNISSMFNPEETSTPEKASVEVKKLNLSAIYNKNQDSDEESIPQKEALPQAKKLNLSEFLQSNAEVKVEKEGAPSVGKLNLSAILPTESENESDEKKEKEKVVVKKLDTDEILKKMSESAVTNNEGSTTVKQVGKIDQSQLFQNSERESVVQKEVVKVGKLKVSEEMFAHENEDEEKVKSEKISRAQSIKKIDRSKYLQSNVEQNDENVSSEKPVVGKLQVDAMQFESPEKDSQHREAHANVGKLNVSEDMFMSATEEEETRLKQAKLQRHQTISKIDTTKLFVGSEQESAAVEREKIQVNKLKVSEDQFKMESEEKLRELENEKLNRLSSISKIDKSKLEFKSSEEESAPVNTERPQQVNKLTIKEEMFTEGVGQPKSEEKPVSVGKIDTNQLQFASPNETIKRTAEDAPSQISKLSVSEDMFRESTTEEEERLKQAKLQRHQTISKIDTTKLFTSNEEHEAAPEKEKVEVKKLNISEDQFKMESEEKLQELKNEKLSRVNSINKIDKSKLQFKPSEEETQFVNPERPQQVNKLTIKEEMFSETSQPTLEQKVVNVGKLDTTNLQFSSPNEQIKRTAEDAPCQISKLNVSEAMFTESSLEDDALKEAKVQRTKSISKMDSSRYKLKSATEESAETCPVSQKPVAVGKLNVDGLFSAPSESDQQTSRNQKRNLQELLKAEKERNKLNPVSPESMHAQHKKSNTSGVEGEIEEDTLDMQSESIAHSVPQDNFLHGAKQTEEEASPEPASGDVPAKSAAQKVAAAAAGAGAEADRSHLCRVCEKKVYETEKISASGTLYHKSCFRCAQCNSILRMTTYCLSVNGEIYCKPHFDQLFKVKGSYNIESNSGALKSFRESQLESADSESGTPKNPDDVTEEDDVSLPDLKSIKNRFESVANGHNQDALVIDKDSQPSPNNSANVSSLKNQWASMSAGNSSSSPNTAASRKSEEIQLCRSASQLRAQFDKSQYSAPSDASMDGETGKEEASQRERPETVAGGLASVKSMFEGGDRRNAEAEQRSQRNVDESLQAAMARGSISTKTMFESNSVSRGDDDDAPAKTNSVYEDESLIAARQGRGAAAKNLFMNQSESPKAETTNGHSQDDELAAIRASRGTNIKAMFEGGSNENKAQISRTYEDESLAAARASRGVAIKSKFESSQQETTVVRTESQPADVQAGKAKDLLSKFESGHLNDDSSNNYSSRGASDVVVNSEATRSAKAVFQQQKPSVAKVNGSGGGAVDSSVDNAQVEVVVTPSEDNNSFADLEASSVDPTPVTDG